MISPVLASLKAEIELLKQGKLCVPRMAILTPTYKCNQNCYYCFFKSKNNGDMIEIDKLSNIIKQIADFGIQGLEWCGGGEALILPKIEDVFKYAATLGLRQGLLTNGILFEGKIAETFLKHGTYVRFSLDTVSREKYKKIRGSDDCEKVKKNIEDAVKIKQKHDYMCEISIKIGYARELTMEDVQCVFDFAHGKRIHNIQLKNVWDENGQYYNDNLQKEDVYRIIKTHNIRFAKKIGVRKSLRYRCWINPVQIMIDAYGDCYLCCYMQNREKTHKIGNIFKSTLKDIWYSNEHIHAIRNVSINECMKHDCRFIRYQDMWRHEEKSRDLSFC